jgi:large subunit ribosomal protein L10
MPQTKEQKQKSLKDIKEGVDKQKSMVFVAFEGLKTSDILELKKNLKEAGCKFLVVKKTLFNLALKDKKIDFDSREFEGQLGLVLGFEDEVSAAKLSHQFAKKNANLKILGGFFENEMIGLEKVTALAQIPSREELLAKFVGSISSPISGFANVLQGNIKGLIYALNAIKNK